MAERLRKSFFGGRGFAQAAGRPWISRNLEALISRTLPVRLRRSYYDLFNAIATAPTSWAAVPTATSPPTITYGTSNDTPDTSKLGGVAWKRYWFRGNNGQIENTGGGRTLLQRADFGSFLTQGPALGGGINYNNNSGNSTEWWQNFQGLLRAGQAQEDIGDFSNWAWGFTLTGRGFAFNGQNYTDFVVYVQEGGVLKRCPYQVFPQSDSYTYIDFGSSATRNILLVIEPDSWSSEVLIPTTATMVPWSGWRTGKLQISIMGDSYFQGMNTTAGAAFAEQVALLVGGTSAMTVSAQGGSGYASDNGDAVNVRPMHTAHRQNRFSVGQPDAKMVFAGINDGWPTTSTSGGTVNTAWAIDKVLRDARRLDPSTLLVVGSPWAPNGPNGQNPSGKYQQINNYVRDTALPRDTGLWIFIDSLNGTWRTSLGDQRATAEGAWITGTGNSGAPNGTGNADTYIGPDGTHPNDAGRTYLAQKIGQYMREAATVMLQRSAVASSSLQGVTQTATTVAINNIFGGAFDAAIFDPDIFEASYGQVLAGVTQTATLQGASSGRSASATQTLDNVAQTATAAAVAQLVATQTLAGVAQSATVSARASATATQTLAGTAQVGTLASVASLSAFQPLDNVTQAATAVTASGLTAAQTLAGVTQAAAAAVRGAATATQTLAGVTQTATAAGVPALAATQTLAGVTQTATATVSTVLSATATQTLAGVTQAAAAVAQVAAAASQTLDNVAQSAAAIHGLASATATQTLAGVAQAAAAQAIAKASATQTLDNVAQTATGTAPPLSGLFGSQQLAGVTQTATATETVKAAATQTLLGVVSTATAAVLEKLQAAQTLAGVSQTATVTHGQASATATQALAGVSQTAAAIGIKGITGAQVLDGVSQTATALRLSGLSGAQVLENVIQLAIVRHELSIETNARTYLVRAEDREMAGVPHEDRHYGIIAQLRDYIPADQSRVYDNAAS